MDHSPALLGASRLLVTAPVLTTALIAFAACAPARVAPPGYTDYGDAYVRGHREANGDVQASVRGDDGAEVVALRFIAATHQWAYQVPGQDEVTGDAPDLEASPEGLGRAAYFIYRQTHAWHDSPGCDPPADRIQTACTSGCCADHDQCYQERSCTSSSWYDGSMGSVWPLPRLPSACGRCNWGAVGCFVGRYANTSLSCECRDGDCCQQSGDYHTCYSAATSERYCGNGSCKEEDRVDGGEMMMSENDADGGDDEADAGDDEADAGDDEADAGDDEADAGTDQIDDDAGQDPGADDDAGQDPGTDDDAGTNDPPTNDPPANDPPANDPPANDPPANDPPANDPPANDPPADDSANSV